MNIFGSWCCVLFLLVVSSVSLNASERTISVQAKRTALVIGNSNYDVSPLKNPVHDANDLSEILKANGFDVILRLDATDRQMKEAVREFGNRLGQGGVGLFYYAGHGMQVKGRNYLIPIGSSVTTQSDVEFESMDAARVLGKMEDAGTAINLVILDACRNNPFSRSFRSAGGGLARMDAPTGSLIAYATAPGSVAADGNGRNGVYTKHLLRNLGKPGLKIERVFKNVRVAVLEETEQQQTPWESSSLTGDFVFNNGGLQSAVSPELANIPKTDKDLKSVTRHHGLAFKPVKIGLSGHYLGIGTDKGSYKYLYNITESYFDNDKLPYYSFAKNKSYWKDYSIRIRGAPNKTSVLELRVLGEVELTINMDDQRYGTISEHTFTNLGNILIGTTNGYVLLYDKEGKIIHNYNGQAGAVQALAVHRDTIAVAFANGTIAIFSSLERNQNAGGIISLLQ